MMTTDLLPTVPPGALSPCSPQAEAHLALMMSGQHEDLLDEWLTAFIKSNKQMHTATLSRLEKYVNMQPFYWTEVETIHKSHHHEPQHPGYFFNNWHKSHIFPDLEQLTHDQIEQLWRDEDLELSKRHLFLSSLRAFDPSFALYLIQSSWKANKLKARGHFLDTLNINLSLADEPFVESALDDRARNVRRIAANLLRDLPGSRFAQRMLDRVTQLISYIPSSNPGKPARFKISLPTAYTPAMERDGIYKYSFSIDMDDPSAWLCEMIGLIPTQTWPRLWNSSPIDLIAAANASGKRKNILLEGWRDACYHFKDPDWTSARIQTDPTLISEISGPGVLALLRPQEREALIMQSLASTPNAIYTGEVPLPLLGSLERPWSADFSRFILSRLQHYTTPGAPEDPELLETIPAIARALSPSLDDEAESLLQLDQAANPFYTPALTSLVQTLNFRHEMLEALQ